jgi:hypothetical protein
MLRRDRLDLAFGRELELAQRFEIELEDVLHRPVLKAVFDRPVLQARLACLKNWASSGTCTIEKPPFSM